MKKIEVEKFSVMFFLMLVLFLIFVTSSSHDREELTGNTNVIENYSKGYLEKIKQKNDTIFLLINELSQRTQSLIDENKKLKYEKH